MFPSIEKYIPEVRFNNFTDKWTHRKLINAIKLNKPQHVKKESLSAIPIGYYVLAMRTFTKDGYIDISKSYWFNDKKASGFPEDKFLLPNEMAIMDADMDATLPKIGKTLLNATNKKYLLAAHVRKIKAKSEFNIGFLFGTLQTEYMIKKFKLASNGSIAKGLLDKDIYKQRFYAPEYCEQVQIGLLLISVEKFISFQKNSKNEMNRLKKALLQKIFI